MNKVKRQFEPLLSRSFRFQQSENAELVYTGNWGPVIQDETLAASAWTVERGDAVLSDEAFTADGVTSVTVSGIPGESTIVNKVTLSNGEIDERILQVRITDNDVPRYDNDYGMI